MKSFGCLTRLLLFVLASVCVFMFAKGFYLFALDYCPSSRFGTACLLTTLLIMVFACVIEAIVVMVTMMTKLED